MKTLRGEIPSGLIAPFLYSIGKVSFKRVHILDIPAFQFDHPGKVVLGEPFIQGWPKMRWFDDDGNHQIGLRQCIDKVHQAQTSIDIKYYLLEEMGSQAGRMISDKWDIPWNTAAFMHGPFIEISEDTKTRLDFLHVIWYLRLASIELP